MRTGQPRIERLERRTPRQSETAVTPARRCADQATHASWHLAPLPAPARHRRRQLRAEPPPTACPAGARPRLVRSAAAAAQGSPPRSHLRARRYGAHRHAATHSATASARSERRHAPVTSLEALHASDIVTRRQLPPRKVSSKPPSRDEARRSDHRATSTARRTPRRRSVASPANSPCSDIARSSRDARDPPPRCDSPRSPPRSRSHRTHSNAMERCCTLRPWRSATQPPSRSAESLLEAAPRRSRRRQHPWHTEF